MNEISLDQELDQTTKTPYTKKEKRIIAALFVAGAIFGGTAAHLGCKKAGMFDTDED